MVDTPQDRNQHTNIGVHEGNTVVSPDEAVSNGLKVWADIGVKIGQSVDESTKAHDRLAQQLQQNTPVFYATVASGTCVNSSTPLVLNLGTPDQGTYWEVTSVAVGGVDYTTVAGGTAGLYVSGYVNANTLEMSVLADYASSLPNVGFYGTRQLLVNDQETLVLLVDGGTAGQVYVANAQMSVFNVMAAMGRTATVA